MTFLKNKSAQKCIRLSLCVLLLMLTGCQPPKTAEVAADYQGFFGTPTGKKRLGFAAKIKQTGTTLKGTYELNGTKTHPLEGTVNGNDVTLVLKNVPKQVVSEGRKLDFWDSEEPLVLSGSFKINTDDIMVIYGNLDAGEWVVPWQLRAKKSTDS